MISDSSDYREYIAVVGLAGRFPQSRNVDELWQHLREGEDLVKRLSEEELIALGTPESLLRDPGFVPVDLEIENSEMFDASFFDFSPREAETLDPQQRFFLETCWEALENAGYVPECCKGPVGVFAGESDYNRFARGGVPDSTNYLDSYNQCLGQGLDFLATRVSYKMNLNGPAYTVQCACSSSLVALNLACQSLFTSQCDMALAGGVSICIMPQKGYVYHEGLLNSPDGCCRAFDAKAGGTVFGQGSAVVVLKRLSEAIADGDNIRAVIRGVAINNDGSDKASYTSPSVSGQAHVTAMAHALAEVTADSISYVEAHGTGTQLGDPVEIAALTQAFRATTDKKGYCAIGSIKTNIGHLDAAAGAAGLVKAILALERQEIPPSLHFEEPNGEIDFANSPFFVNTKLRKWDTNGQPRRAGVSAFGVGGTNVHVVLEEAPARKSVVEPEADQLLVLSAKSSKALDNLTRNLVDHLQREPQLNLADVAYTLQQGRREFAHRRIAVCGSTADAVETLGGSDPARVVTGTREPGKRTLAFLFPGQGSQHVNMAKDLYASHETVRNEFDRCCELLKPHLGLDLRQIVYPSADGEEAAAEKLNQTAYTQPALFAVEYALARQWEAWGIESDVLLGHSVGEYVAACLGGVFSLEDGLKLIAARGRLLQSLPTGSMLAVPLRPEEVEPYLGDSLSIAAVNAPDMCVVSGEDAAIAQLEETLARSHPGSRRLHTSHAFHSKMVEPILEPFEKELREITLHAPTKRIVANGSGDWMTAEQATSVEYWVAHVRGTVRFADSISCLQNEKDIVLMEVGPGNTLSALSRMQTEGPVRQRIVTSMRHPRENTPDDRVLLTALGRLWIAGVEVDWSKSHRNENRQRVVLPTYPFDHQKFETLLPDAGVCRASTTTDSQAAVRSGSPPPKMEDIGDWFYAPTWSQSPIVYASDEHNSDQSPWLFLHDDHPLSAEVVARLRSAGETVMEVKCGDSFTKGERGNYTLDPSNEEHYGQLIEDLTATNQMPRTIVHAWNLSRENLREWDDSRLEHNKDLAFHSLLYLARAIGRVQTADKFSIFALSNQAHEVLGDESLRPIQSLLFGACKIIPREYTSIGCRSIDVACDGTLDTRLVNQVVGEIRTASNDDSIAYRGNHRWRRSYEPIRLGPEAPLERLKQGGVYLITGGLGGIGLAVAQFLAEEWNAKLVLLGRSAMPPRESWDAWLQEHDDEREMCDRIRQLQAIEKSGGEVMLAQADVADHTAMQSVVDSAVAKFGSLNGVFHAAGVFDRGGFIHRRTKESSEEVFAPKVDGTLIVQDVVKDQKLDLFVIFSSLASVTTNTMFGQVAYCAANSFLDAFAHGNTTLEGTSTIALNWDVWSTGMAERAREHNVANYKGVELLSAESLAIEPDEGVEALRRGINSGFGQLAVSLQDLSWRLNVTLDDVSSQDEDGTSAAEANGAAADSSSAAEGYDRPDVATPYVAPQTEQEEKVAAVWRELLGFREIGVNDNFFELGGHSILAVRVVARVSDAFGLQVPLQVLFENPTIAGMAEQVGAMGGTDSNGSKPEAASGRTLEGTI